ncbi:pitrilysin [Actinobacillus equuli subsp. haemolyticus]|uniref:pitrilysin n=1 Tax=Actinobacillus equuli TaxID=718 RepID=UPI002418BB5D|nr:pitrilysin [Actinobacillus equuli]MDG4947600.1 pitrilysin [Actinobacillus equuli subsp. haemolyticus]
MKKTLISRMIRHTLYSAIALSVSVTTTFANIPQNPTASTSLSAAQTQGFKFINQQINKSPNDNAIYQAIRLKNDMTVLLISDSKANKSLMSLALPIGSMEDPIQQQGLAHYLEHMILMGSKQFPETSSLDRFLTENGGYNNASTTADRTAYYLEVNNNAFDGAVTRLADAFAQPLLSENNAKREVNAVNAEMVRAKSSDGYLLNSVNLATANPAHPITKFAVGNKETLSDKPNSKLQTELERFYQRYYSANLVKAVLYSNQSIEQLAALADRTLGKVPNKNIAAPSVDVPFFRAEDKGVVIHYKPVQPTKMLAVSFDVPNDETQFAHKTGDYLAYILNNNTDGTLSDYLIKQGLSDSGIAAQATPNVSRNRGNFTIYVALTDKGLTEKDKIISLIFQQIEQVKQTGIQESYFNEVRESLKQDFQHLQVEKSGTYIESLAEQMLHYPLEHILDADFMVDTMDKQAIKAKLAEMTLDNARILLVDEKAHTDKKSPYFEANYSIAKISDEQRKKWLDFSHNPALKLPELNPYFATDFSLIQPISDRKVPKALISTAGKAIYAMPSQYFANDPKAIVSMSFSIMPKTDDLKEAMSATLLGYMNSLAQTKLAFQTAVAGMQAAITTYPNRLSVEAAGYTQHLAKLIQDSLNQFKTFELTEDFLAQAKQRAFEALDGQRKESSLTQANQAIANFASYPYFEEDKQRKALTDTTLADVKAMRDRLLTKSTGLGVLSVGNLNDKQVEDLVSDIKGIVKSSEVERGKARYLDLNDSNRKLNYVQTVPHEDNALSITYLAKGYGELEGSARANLLRDIIGRWYFDDLRTQKQLGYVVYATNTKLGKTAGMRFMVQSPNTTPAGIMQHNQRFFAESLTKLTALSEQEFVKYRESLIEKLQRKPESLNQEFSQFTFDFNRRNDQFNQRAKMIEAVKQLTQQDIVDFYKHTVIEQQGFSFISQALGTKAKAEDAVKLAGYEKVESIEQMQKQFPVKYY